MHFLKLPNLPQFSFYFYFVLVHIHYIFNFFSCSGMEISDFLES